MDSGGIYRKTKERWSRLVGRFLVAVRARGLLGALFRGARLARITSTQKILKNVSRARYRRRVQELGAMIAQPWPFIDLLHAPMGWHTELFQRFQHLSLQASKMGGLALYGGHPSLDRGLFVYKAISQSLCVFDATDREIVNHIVELAAKQSTPRMVRIQSIDPATTTAEAFSFLQKGFVVIYEYIDEINPDIMGKVPDLVHRRHAALLSDERILVVATSDKLFEQVQAVRSHGILLSTNGVDLDHWRVNPGKPPRDLQAALSGRTIVGYHGAIAKWIDYDLLRRIADDGRYEIVIIGREHDRSFSRSGLTRHPRVHFLGSKSYTDLSAYAAYYDVGILPFRVSALTQSVSPLKIFEYMAASKPIVTYDLRECRKYRSCLIAEDAAGIMSRLDLARHLKHDPGYLSILEREAKQNSWQSKIRDLLTLANIPIK